MCIHNVEFEDSELKEDYMRLTFCFEYDYLKIKEFENVEVSPALEECFK